MRVVVNEGRTAGYVSIERAYMDGVSLDDAFERIFIGEISFKPARAPVVFVVDYETMQRDDVEYSSHIFLDTDELFAELNNASTNVFTRPVKITAVPIVDLPKDSLAAEGEAA